MREALIYIPVEDSNGKALGDVINGAIKALVSEFGGAISQLTNGYWVNPDGRLFAEEVQAITVAVPETDRSKRVLRNIAGYVGINGRQEAVYIRHHDGEVEFVTDYGFNDAVAAK